MSIGHATQKSLILKGFLGVGGRNEEKHATPTGMKLPEGRSQWIMESGEWTVPNGHSQDIGRTKS